MGHMAGKIKRLDWGVLGRKESERRVVNVVGLGQKAGSGD